MHQENSGYKGHDIQLVNNYWRIKVEICYLVMMICKMFFANWFGTNMKETQVMFVKRFHLTKIT